MSLSCPLCGQASEDNVGGNQLTSTSKTKSSQKLQEILSMANKQLDASKSDDQSLCERCHQLVDQYDCFEEQLKKTFEQINLLFGAKSQGEERQPGGVEQPNLQLLDLLLLETPPDQEVDAFYSSSCCQNVFKSVDEKGRHLLQVHSEATSVYYFCPRDLVTTSDFREMESHQCSEEANALELTEESEGNQCDECGIMSNESLAILLHKRRVHKEKLRWPDSCRLCPQGSSVHSNLKDHLMEEHFPKQPRAIETASEAVFWDMKRLEAKKGQKLPVQEGDRKCFDCEKEFSSWSKKIAHRLSAHRPIDMESYKCGRCNHATDSEDNIVRHVRTSGCKETTAREEGAKNEGYSQCTKCDVLCSTELAVKYHFKNSHTRKSSASLNKCPLCSKWFKNKTSLDNHVSSVHSSAFNCTHCGRAFKTDSGLAKHTQKCSYRDLNSSSLVNSVSSKKQMSCRLCKQSYKTEMILARHMLSVHNETIPVSCPTCSDVFQSTSALHEHRVAVHNPKRFPCTTCGRQLLSHNALENHRRSLHGEDLGRDKSICEVCSKSFHTVYHLQNHLKVHRDETTHDCKLCEKKFRWPSSLTSHIRAAHETSSKVAIECPHCKRTFKEKNNLRKHLFTHSDEKPHSCLVCGKGFIRRDLLTRHQAKCQEKSQETVLLDLNQTDSFILTSLMENPDAMLTL